ncbi:hypothetical protein BHE90_010657 [Fusarium euwallaceae]|uniref:Asl1-like glycosyl hydrolase catalytic domain-containing protein n=3 Tax=Fusarium solani species complex TaxID=232080 RepID=A0A428T8T9_9HYPO|nr:hypothetical protein CEP51_011892 [Fusarium floridanum]RSL98455.1 hypothetical protein CEP52_010301 [Fusarium oligoseptatum]RTE74891.1 hypothetical protein BHE90_010657 [Fusarium euwallaceae]
MIGNKLTLLTATAALLEPALGLNVHRHRHQHVQKRAEWVTATIDGQVVSWENNYFGPVSQAPAAAAPAAAATTQASAPAAEKQVEAPAAVAVQPTTLAQVAKPAKVSKVASKAVFKEEAQAAATTTTAAAAATSKVTTKTTSSSSSGSVGFSHKRGLAYNDVDLANTFASSCSNCGWAYNWGPSSGGIKGLNFIPTLWGDDDEKVTNFEAGIDECLSNGAKAIFSFNEPDNGGQANMEPARAAASHVKLLNGYSGKALIGAPSISNSGLDGEGIAWLKSWVSACESAGCKYDFCNVHWYSEVEYGETLFEHLKAAHETCGGKPIWLTEFAPTGSDEAIASWLEEAIPRLEALEYLDAYSYFMVSQGMLMTSASELSTYGKVYASA